MQGYRALGSANLPLVDEKMITSAQPTPPPIVRIQGSSVRTGPVCLHLSVSLKINNR